MKTASPASEVKPPLAIVIWLFVVAGLVLLMIMLGGYTRLTQSGLSIVTWKPITGTLPPLSETAWLEHFSLYQASPEYLKINQNMTLSAYKSIYYVEYFHRLLGRVIGLAYFIPLLIFGFKAQIPAHYKKHLGLLLLLGGFQGGLGWFMVKSGLVNNPHVSQYRLTAHLMTALLVYIGLLWVAFGILKSQSPTPEQQEQTQALSFWAWALMALSCLTIMSGGFMAGMRAGLVFPTFPKFGDVWLPENMYSLHPFWLNWFENLVSIHFNHRLLALILLVGIGVLCYLLYQQKTNHHKLILLLLLLIGNQVLLGALTVLWLVPIPIAVAHQGNAFLLLATFIYLIQRLRLPRLSVGPSVAESKKA